MLTTLVSGLTYTDTTAVNGTTYFYEVEAVNGVGTGPVSNEKSATPATIPGAPTLTSATGGNNQVVLDWTAPSSNGGSGITSYTILRGTSSGTETVLTTLVSGLTYTDTTAVNGTTYFYEVEAVNGVGTGPVSNEKSATPTSGETVPGAPTLTSATGGNNQVVLDWTAPSSNGGSGITSYTILRGTSSGTETVLTTLVSGLTYTDTTAVNGTTYFYEVEAVNGVGTGPVSNEKSATPTSGETVPGAPTLTSATGGNNQVVLDWTAPSSNGGSGITSYTIFRGTSSGTETVLTTLVSGLTYTDTTAVNGTTYFYEVEAVNGVGTGPVSNEKSATPATIPGAPTLTSATGSNGEVILDWTAPSSNGGSGITSYTILRGTSSGTETVLTTLVSGLTYTDTTAVNGTTYFYEVEAVNGVGTGPVSNEKSATPATIPGAPTLTSATGGNNQVVLDWTAPSSNGGSGITSYTILRGTSSGTETVLTTLVSGLTYTDTTAVNGTTYFYEVEAVNGVGTGPVSNEKSATPTSGETVPGAPTLTSATGGNNQVVLDWTAPSSNGGSGITSYTILRGTSSGTETVLTTLVSGLTYTDTTAVNGTTYFYEVEAVNGVGTGPVSNEKSATPATIPGAPTLTSATGGNNQVVLDWTAPSSNGGSGITSYTILRGTSSGTETVLTTLVSGLTYTDTTAVNGTTYFYEVEAVNGVGTGPVSNEKSATPATIPGAPTLTSATGGNNQVVLDWTAPSSNGGSGITSYTILRGTSSGTETVLTTLVSGLTYTDTTAVNGTTYFYEVEAVNGVGTGPVSNEKSATPATIPGAPTLTSATGGNNQVVLDWTAPSSNGGSGITSYTILRGTSSGTETVLTTLVSGLTYTDTTAVNGTTYFYEVEAVNGVGTGPVSNEKSATPTSGETVPGAPTLTSATGGNNQVVLDWTAPSSNGGSGITSYTILRGTSSGTETVLTTLVSGLTYTDTTAVNGTTYFYEVEAVNGVGTGPVSNEKSATPATIPGAPTLTSATGGNNQVVLDWTAPSSNGGSGITSYTILRGTSSGTETVLTTLVSGLTYTDTTAVNGTTYFYEVEAVNGVGTGPVSNEKSATPTGTTSSNNLRIQLSSPGLISGVGGLYLITVTNLAATPTTGTLTITDVLPSGLSYIGGLVYPPGFHCSAAAGTVTCTDSTAIAAHATVDLLGVVGVSARAGTSITDTVTLAPVGTPASNYTATVKTTVSAR